MKVFTTNPMKSNIKFLLLLLLITFGFAWILDFDCASTNSYLLPDSASYLEVSSSLKPDSFRTIGYPLFLRLVLNEEFSALKFHTLYIIQLLLWIISCLIFFRIVTHYASQKMSFIFCLSVVVNPTFMIYTHAILTEILFLSLLILSSYFIHLYFKLKKQYFLYVSFAIICVATLVRPGLLWLNGFALIYFTFLSTKKFSSFSIFTLIFLCFIGTEMSRYYNQFGLVKLSIIDDITTYRYLNAQAKSFVKNCSTIEAMATQDSSLNLNQKVSSLSSFCKKDFKELRSKHLIEIARAFIFDLYSNFHTGNVSYKSANKEQANHLFNITRIFNMLFVIGLIFYNFIFLYSYLKHKLRTDNTFKILTWLLILTNYLWIVSGVSFWQGDRFNVVWFPLFVIILSISFNIFRSQKQLIIENSV